MSDSHLKLLLEDYLDKLNNNVLSLEEKINLIEFFVNDPVNKGNEVNGVNNGVNNTLINKYNR
jgi:hypothetical protein